MKAVSCLLDPVKFAKEVLNFHPDPLQERVLDPQNTHGILNCTRQWGESTLTALKAVHRAYFDNGALVLVVSPSERQSAEFVLKAAQFVRELGLPVKGDGRNKISLLLPNGSRIIGLPSREMTVRRGFSAVSLLIVDEAARVPDMMYNAIRPMLAVSDGDLWLMSTPFGKRGCFFYEEWIGKDSRLDAHHGNRREVLSHLAKVPGKRAPQSERRLVPPGLSVNFAPWNPEPSSMKP